MTVANWSGLCTVIVEETKKGREGGGLYYGAEYNTCYRLGEAMRNAVGVVLP